MTTKNQIQLFQSADGKVQLEVPLEQDTAWLTQAQMCELFKRDQSVISDKPRAEAVLDEVWMAMLAAGIVTQLIASILIDHFGLLGRLRISISPSRVFGVVLLFIGLYFIERKTL